MGCLRMGELAVNTRHLFILRDVQSSKVPVLYFSVFLFSFRIRPSFLRNFAHFLFVVVNVTSLLFSSLLHQSDPVIARALASSQSPALMPE